MSRRPSISLPVHYMSSARSGRSSTCWIRLNDEIGLTLMDEHLPSACAATIAVGVDLHANLTHRPHGNAPPIVDLLLKQNVVTTAILTSSPSDSTLRVG